MEKAVREEIWIMQRHQGVHAIDDEESQSALYRENQVVSGNAALVDGGRMMSQASMGVVAVVWRYAWVNTTCVKGHVADHTGARLL